MKVWLHYAFLGLALAGRAASQPLPDPVWPVRDDYGLLGEETATAVRTQIERLEAETTAEIGVLIVASTGGREAHDYALAVFNYWGIGKAESNNGVLLLFAMEDRRVELVPGIAYEDLFNQRRTVQLLQGVVVPLMRADQSQRAVAAIVEEVAREIRIHDGFEPPARSGVGELAVGERTAGSTSSPVASRSGLARSEEAHFDYRRRQLTFGILGLVLFSVWIGGFGFVLFIALRRGRLLMPRWALWTLIVLGLVFMGGLGLFLTVEGVFGAWVVSVGGVLGALGFGAVVRHVCPQCHRWCDIETRTLRQASLTSSGSGERTFHCEHCGYHDVKIYTIGAKTKDSSSGISFRIGSSSGSSSFGGGSSRGGGGGASW